MKKAIFIFKFGCDIQALVAFFQRMQIHVTFHNLRQVIWEHKARLASLYLKQVNAYFIVNVEIIFGHEDFILFHTSPLHYSIVADHYVIMGNVPYMATPLVTEIPMVGAWTELILKEV